MRFIKFISVSFLFFFTACGPGREAAWERESAETLKAKPGVEASADKKTLAAEAWAKRDERAQLEKAVALWDAVCAEDPSDVESLTSLARAYYLLGDGFIRVGGDTDAMIATFEKGVLAGEKAMLASSEEFSTRVRNGEKVEEAVVAIPSSGQPAMYWYASNLGKFAVAKGFTTTLFYKDRIKSIMEHAQKIDENYFYGAPHRYFGAFYAKAPSFAGGDMDKSKQHFDRSLEIAPDYLGTKVLYAEYYAAKSGDRELFDRLLNEVLNADPKVLPDIIPEQQMEQAKAKILVGQADEIF